MIAEWAQRALGDHRTAAQRDADEAIEAALADARNPLVRLREDITAVLDEFVHRCEVAGETVEEQCPGCVHFGRLGQWTNGTTVVILGRAARRPARRRTAPAPGQLELVV